MDGSDIGTAEDQRRREAERQRAEQQATQRQPSTNPYHKTLSWNINLDVLRMPSYNFTLFADYYQFYLQDEGAGGDLSDSWTERATKDLLAVAPGTIAVGTVRDMDVPVEVEIRDSEPAGDLNEWDHVTECGIEIPSGRIVVAGCTDYFPDAPPS